MKIDLTHSVWPWIAERAGFLLTRFEVGRDGKTACERLKGKSAKCSRLGARGRNLVEEKTSRRLSGKLTCMWEDGVCLGSKATIGEVIVGERNGVRLTRTVRKKTATERCERSNLEMIVAVPLRKNDDGEKMDGERLEGEVVLMDKDFRDKLEMEEHVSVPKRAYISREDVDMCGFTQDAMGACQYSKEQRGMPTRKVVEEELKER